MDRDRKLIKKIKRKSDKDAANELISKYYKEVYTYVYKQTIDKELSMDLTQDIFINVLKSIHGYDEKKANFRTWLYRIATNRLVDYYRSRSYKYSNTLVSIDNIQIFNEKDLEITVENREDVKMIITAVNGLDILSQQIFRLKIFADYTFNKISKVLNIPESTVKTRYYSILKKIREEFKEG